jgi:hypothetical protein
MRSSGGATWSGHTSWAWSILAELTSASLYLTAPK